MSALSAIAEVADLSWRQILRSKQLLGIGLVILFAVCLAYLLRRDEPTRAAEGFQFLQLFLLVQVVAPLVALLFGTGALASERESGTLSYLFTRPVPRWSVLVGKSIGAMAAANAAVLVCVVLVYLAMGAPAGAELGGGIAALLLGTTALTAVFILFGTLFPYSLYVGLVYIALFEGLAGNVAGARSGWTVTFHARRLLADWSSGAMPVAGNPLTDLRGGADESVTALLVVALAAIAVAAVWIETREYGLRDRSRGE